MTHKGFWNWRNPTNGSSLPVSKLEWGVAFGDTEIPVLYLRLDAWMRDASKLLQVKLQQSSSNSLLLHNPMHPVRNGAFVESSIIIMPNLFKPNLTAFTRHVKAIHFINFYI